MYMDKTAASGVDTETLEREAEEIVLANPTPPPLPLSLPTKLNENSAIKTFGLFVFQKINTSERGRAAAPLTPSQKKKRKSTPKHLNKEEKKMLEKVGGHRVYRNTKCSGEMKSGRTPIDKARGGE